MLSMKTLRVAFAAAAAALLLGSGLASARVQHLDGTRAAGTLPTPLVYAQELLRAGTSLTPIWYGDLSDGDDDTHKLAADLGERIETRNAEAYIHLRLHGGMQFSRSATNLDWFAGAFPDGMFPERYRCTAGENTVPDHLGEAGVPLSGVVHISGGEPSSDSVVYRIDVGEGSGFTNPFGEPRDGNGIPAALPVDASRDAGFGAECDLAGAPIRIWVNVNEYLRIPSGPGVYGASLTLQTRQTRTLGSATIVEAIDGLKVEVKSKTDTAQVGSTPQPFLWFDGSPTERGKGMLGSAMADRAPLRPGVMLLNPEKGTPVVPADLLEPGSLSFTVKGDLSFGAFNLKKNPASDDSFDACVGPGGPGRPSMGNLKPDEDDTSMATLAG